MGRGCLAKFVQAHVLGYFIFGSSLEDPNINSIRALIC